MFYTHLLKQQLTLCKIDGTDEYSMPNIVETIENVPCCITYKNKLIIARNGEQITSEGNILTEKEIKAGDLIKLNETDYKIISVNPLYDFDNNLQGYKAYFGGV